ncbi:MAG: hypothetical protein VYA17_13665 [Pseudomonadota bacterium]|nr:hypothetical protein [Pseudomonadota bacterium]
MTEFMSSSDHPPEEVENSPFQGKAVERIAEETGDPLANVEHETAALKELAQKLIDLPEGEVPTPEMIRSGLDALTKLYTVRFQAGERWDPFINGRAVPVTSVMIMTTAMLQAVNIELFELGMWQAWSGG